MADIIFKEEGAIGLIRLNRPNALNALSLSMIQSIQQQLTAWKIAPNIAAVVIEGEGEKAFCAGGDIRWLYETGKANDPILKSFFWHEYRLNYFIHSYPKPFIALLNGITMGGGVGISLHGAYPIASERFVFSMPETSIGFFPDIGASFLLSRCPGSMGVYLGLTGARLNAEEAYSLGLVQSVIPSQSFPDILKWLRNLKSFSHETFKKYLSELGHLEKIKLPNQDLIDVCFSKGTVEDIFSVLEKMNNEWALATLKELKQKCPLSLKVTLEQIQRAKNKSMAECLEMDYSMVNEFILNPNFYEGVRALLIDKDKNPQWLPKKIDEVTKSQVELFFEYREKLELNDHLSACSLIS